MLNNLFTKTEQRAISFQSIWGAGDTLAFTTTAGTNIDENTAMQISAFYSCVLLISDTISTLPMDTFIRRSGDRVPYRPRPEWVMKPDIDLSKRTTFALSFDEANSRSSTPIKDEMIGGNSDGLRSMRKFFVY